jgi:signal transduction histidine kinase
LVGLLREMIEEYDEDRYLVPKSVLDLSINSAEQHMLLIQRVTEIGMLNAEEKVTSRAPLSRVTAFLEELVMKELTTFVDRYDRTVSLERTRPEILRDDTTTVAWDDDMVRRILHELTCNAIKYSPPESPLHVGWEVSGNEPGCVDRCLIIRFKNRAVRTQAKDRQGEPVVGVPYEYRETVFELFFTIEAFPQTLPEEQWTDGTGLTFVRTSCQQLGGWADISSGVDHSSGTAEPIVTVTLRFPLHANQASPDGSIDPISSRT